MISRHPALCALMLLALSACASDPEARPRFEDPSVRGSLTDFDAAIVPVDFQGVWADSAAACRNRRLGVWIHVPKQSADGMVVTRVAGYSDDGTAILVDLALPDGAEPYAYYLELSLDGFHMRVTGRGELEHTLYYRCP